MQLQLQDKESTLLRSVLERYLGDLRAEIYKTEDYDYREGLKANEDTIKSILTRLDGHS